VSLTQIDALYFVGVHGSGKQTQAADQDVEYSQDSIPDSDAVGLISGCLLPSPDLDQWQQPCDRTNWLATVASGKVKVMQDISPRSAAAVSLLLSLTVVVMVATAIAGWASALFFAIVAGATVPAFLLQRMFPGSRLLWIAFVNLIAVYASVFTVFAEEAFVRVGPLALSVGFALPVFSFLAGCRWQRDAVKGAIGDPALKGERSLRGSFLWLAPVGLVGVIVVAVSQAAPNTLRGDTAFIVAMLLIAGIVLSVSRNVAVFLVEIGLLFEEFFHRVTHLLVPACAFLTVYSLIVVVFAAAYTIASKLGLQDHFRISGVVRALSFPEALHFSITTLSTVGYGDIVPASSMGRSLAAIQVIIGTLLLLFGVSEILEYSRERRRRHSRDSRSGTPSSTTIGCRVHNDQTCRVGSVPSLAGGEGISYHQLAAVDGQGGAGDETGIVAGQKGHCARDVSRCSQPADGNACDNCFHHVG
jgi:voltage-gated potassium channel